MESMKNQYFFKFTKKLWIEELSNVATNVTQSSGGHGSIVFKLRVKLINQISYDAMLIDVNQEWKSRRIAYNANDLLFSLVHFWFSLCNRISSIMCVNAVNRK